MSLLVLRDMKYFSLSTTQFLILFIERETPVLSAYDESLVVYYATGAGLSY